MESSPRRSSLYRKGICAVILASVTVLAAVWLAGQAITPRYGRKAQTSKGPRALGLVQLAPKGNKGRLIPIAIMMDGKFYDAGSYKATPVPLALDFDTVYEGFHTGVSQGLFTISQPGQLNHAWIAEGTWLPAGATAPSKGKKYSAPVIEDPDAPPVLHRHDDKPGDTGSASKDGSKDASKEKGQQGSASSSGGSPAASAPVQSDTTKPSAPPEAAKPEESSEGEPIADPSHPRLRRGKPNVSARHEPYVTFDTESAPSAQTTGAASGGKSGAARGAATSTPTIVMIPAISDARGPDPRPYTYDMKPTEEAGYRSKMLELAASEIRKRETAAAQEAVSGGRRVPAAKSSVRLPKPDFDNVSLHVFDLSNSNEPVLVLSAKTRPPAASSTQEPKEITLIARTNLDGDLLRLFFSQTDSRHLYAAPRMELIDAVDADGDGRGELLFRNTNDNGSAYTIYRVAADRLWPLFEGTP